MAATSRTTLADRSLDQPVARSARRLQQRRQAFNLEFIHSSRPPFFLFECSDQSLGETLLDLSVVKRESEEYVLSRGGGICDWLPSVGLEEISLRDSANVASRALALNILVNVAFGAPIAIARRWLTDNELLDSLTAKESSIIVGECEPSEETRTCLKWQIESLWAAAWVGNLANELSPVQDISSSLASWFPSLRNNEPANAFFEKFNLRSRDDIYKKLDLFYRAHWHSRNCQLEGKDSDPFHPGPVQHRRHFLEWVLHSETKWDDVDLST